MAMDKGLSTVYVRAENRKKVTRLLYRSRALTKQEIARKLNLSIPTANLLVSQLRDEGLVALQSADASSGGRIPEVACFQYQAFYALGLDITEHRVRLALIDLGGQPVLLETMPIEFRNDSSYWICLKDAADQLIRSSGQKRSSVLGLGISIPGVVSPRKQTVDFAPTLNLRKFHYGDLSELLGLPTLVENEANAAGFAEVWMQEDSITDAIYLSLNKGVGGAVISDHNIYYGKNNRSGEFGHMTLIPYGEQCSCGKLGCMEAYCSTRVLTSAVEDSSLSRFFDLKPQSPKLQRVWRDYLDRLAISLSNICIAWDVPLILGGEVTPYLEADFPALVEKVERLVPFESNYPILTLSQTGKNASAIGAALMVVAERLGLLQH